MILREQIADAIAKARRFKTKTARLKAWAKVNELRSQLFLQLCDARDKVARHSIKGIVLAATPGDEHFLVRTTEYGNMWISTASDEISKSWYPHTCCVEYSKGQTVIIECESDVSMRGDDAFLEIVPKRIHGGTLNQTQYEELCKRGNLAFFKYPDGSMSGLFATKKDTV